MLLKVKTGSKTEHVLMPMVKAGAEYRDKCIALVKELGFDAYREKSFTVGTISRLVFTGTWDETKEKEAKVDNKLYRKIRGGWVPKMNSKAGKAIQARIDEIEGVCQLRFKDKTGINFKNSDNYFGTPGYQLVGSVIIISVNDRHIMDTLNVGNPDLIEITNRELGELKEGVKKLNPSKVA